MATTRASILQPELYQPWVQEGMVGKNNILGSGLVEIDNNPPFKKSGEIFHKPYKQSMDNHTGVTEVTAVGTTITPQAFSDYEIKVGSLMVGAGLSTNNYQDITRGDPNVIGDLLTQVGEWNAEESMDYLEACTRGLFITDGKLVSTNQYDAVALGPNGTLTSEVISTAGISVFGEQYEKLNRIIMHSQIYNKYKNENRVEYINAGDLGFLYEGKIPMIDGKAVLLNDTMCAKADSSGDNYYDGKYPTYLVGGKPWYLGYQRNMNMFDDFNPALDGGTYYVYWYWNFGVAVDGVSYTSESSVTKTLLATAASWTKKAATKNIKMVQILTELAT
jgi:hypothetical protein